MNCRDLKEIAGTRFRFEVEASYLAETGNTMLVQVDPWMYFIRCQKGHKDIRVGWRRRNAQGCARGTAARCPLSKGTDRPQ